MDVPDPERGRIALNSGKQSVRPGMVLPLLLVILFFGSLLGILSMTEAERTARSGQFHIDQAPGRTANGRLDQGA